ncbi:speckle-type POZ protein-like [Daphnia pulicaria]|uniref:speckle-type POZ protein-like n=1 Tax=Daphnia pulicaria TaxID=35523 RepID=UPI001EEB8340|nr:speckle-type POZ protein-like [Daphnia pulicaria]
MPPPRGMLRCQTQTIAIQLKYEWPIPQFEKGKGGYSSSQFFHEKDPSIKWFLRLINDGSNLKVYLEMSYPNKQLDYVRVNIGILDKKREKFLPQQHTLSRHAYAPLGVFDIANQMLVESECFVNGKLTFYFEMEYSILKDLALLSKSSTVADLHKKPFNNSGQLIAHLEELYETMKFSDFTINVRGRQFKAHKSILATRSQYFAAMFEHPTKENLTNQVEIEDVEPDVFQEILRYIYTGKVSESTMENMPAGILAVADKYLLEQLKSECETQIIHRMSAENCLELLLNTHEHHPAFYLRKYAVEFFRQFSGEVMATDEWEKAEQGHPELCLTILKELVKSLV